MAKTVSIVDNLWDENCFNFDIIPKWVLSPPTLSLSLFLSYLPWKQTKSIFPCQFTKFSTIRTADLPILMNTKPDILSCFMFRLIVFAILIKLCVCFETIDEYNIPNTVMPFSISTKHECVPLLIDAAHTQAI